VLRKPFHEVPLRSRNGRAAQRQAPSSNDIVKNDATLYVLHVVYAPLASPRFPLEPYEGISEEPAKLELQKIARRHLQGRARYELATRTGKPADVINEAAEELDVDLLVMATHGKTGVTRLLLGSVAEHAVRASKRPVLIIPAKGTEQILQPAASTQS
jgi:universal stress protein A